MSSCKRVVDPDSFTLYKFKGEKPPLLVFVGSFVTMKPIPLVAVETSSADTEIVVKNNDIVNKEKLRNGNLERNKILEIINNSNVQEDYKNFDSNEVINL